MSIQFKGYLYRKLKELEIARIDNGVQIVGTPSNSGLGSVELNKDRLNNYGGGVRFSKVERIDSFTIHIKWITDDWADYDFLYFRLYDEAGNKVFEKSWGNPDAAGTLKEFPWETHTFPVNMENVYIELYLETDYSYPSKCYVDLSSNATITLTYTPEPVPPRGEVINGRTEKYRYAKNVTEELSEVEVYSMYVINNEIYNFYRWSDTVPEHRRSVEIPGSYKAYYVKYIPRFGWDIYNMEWNLALTNTQHIPFIHNSMSKRSCYLFKGQESKYNPVTNPVVRWSYTATYQYVHTPLCNDIDGDGENEVVFADTTEGASYIYCLDKNGQFKWCTYLPEDTYFIGIVDADLDGKHEVYAQCLNDYLYCIKHDGTVKWSIPAGYMAEGSMMFADVNNDFYLEILVTTPYTVRCFNHSGGEVWISNVGNNHSGGLALGDVDNDGVLEIAYGTEEYIAILYLDGSLKRNIDTYQEVSGLNDNIAVTIGDVDGDGVNEIVAASRDILTSYQDKWYCYEGVGTLIWRRIMDGTPWNRAFSLDDIDGDDRVEASAGGGYGVQKIYCIYADDGSNKWVYSTGAEVRAPSIAVDINCDAKREIVNITLSGLLLVIESDGSLLYQVQVDTSSPTRGLLGIFDVDKDKYLEILAPTSNYKLTCIGQSL